MAAFRDVDGRDVDGRDVDGRHDLDVARDENATGSVRSSIVSTSAADTGPDPTPAAAAPTQTTRRRLHDVISATTRDRLHNALIDAPVAGEMYVRLRTQLRHGLVTPRTELILEGYPRSANAYAEWAFRYANGDDVRIAVRMHSPRAVRFGVEHAIPTIVLIRRPLDAVASWLQYKPGLKAERAFWRYALYYEHVYPLRHDVVIADFDEVVADFGAVIKRCNEHYGTSFVPYSGDDEAEAWVREHIERAWAYDETGETPEHRVPRPSNDRHAAKDLLEGVVDDPRVAKAMRSAERMWERFACEEV